jgi:peptidoglycan/xylan/chitin deacetylase (PgdA/CDA1 family)
VVGAVLGPDSNGSFDHLLASVSTLRKTGRPAKLVMFAVPGVGQLPGKTDLEDLSPEFLWAPDDLSARDLLHECDVLVSLQDGVPLLVLRAMASYVPIITTAVRIPEALRNQRTATFIHHGDTSGLQEALLQLAKQRKQKPTLDFLSQESIANYYSETYLWRENEPSSANGHDAEGLALIKKALFSVVPSRQIIRHGNRNRPQIALTIDDGPDAVYTPRMLDILRDHGVKATFFVVGGAAEQYPNLVVRMKEEGHDIGSHSYSHPYFHRLSWKGAMQEIQMTRWVLHRILGEECRLFRPPHGKLSLRSLFPAWAAGQQVVMWNVDLKDYRASPGEVEAHLDRTFLSSGDIVLYHGINDASIRAFPRLIKSALDKGRKAVTISELNRK